MFVWQRDWDQLYELLNRIRKDLKQMQEEIEKLRAQVARNTEVVGSASALLTKLADLIRNAADDPAEVRAIADQLSAQNDALAEAVAANTPAE